MVPLILETCQLWRPSSMIHIYHQPWMSRTCIYENQTCTYSLRIVLTLSELVLAHNLLQNTAQSPKRHNISQQPRQQRCNETETRTLRNSLRLKDTIWRHRSGSTLAQVLACCLTAPSHYLNQCWLIISEVFWYSHEGNFTSLHLSLRWVWKSLIWYYWHISQGLMS